MFSLEITVTPLNHDGKWGKRIKKTTVDGFLTKLDAKNYAASAVKHLCNLSKQKTDTFFAELFILCNGKYVDCDTSIVTYDKDTNKLTFDAA